MSTQDVVIMTCLYLAALLAVTYFTRATAQRLVGALAGGAAVAVVGLGIIALGQVRGWWRVALSESPSFLVLFYLGLAISCSPIPLVTWRVVRRFGWRGLATCVVLVAIIGPPRDYLIAAVFPAWMTFGPGIAPVLAVATFYVSLVALGHAVMRLISGPSGQDPLARRS